MQITNDLFYQTVRKEGEMEGGEGGKREGRGRMNGMREEESKEGREGRMEGERKRGKEGGKRERGSAEGGKKDWKEGGRERGKERRAPQQRHSLKKEELISTMYLAFNCADPHV
jgi:hypothetical protein